ncbi:hypothetical protein [Neisseria polysaccharea]|uniref:hypothetical protein n=1 Tax=Neisseria polysaccharea TaxID=489 RepID=UPI002616C916|nr:hypothetical protein [Neisseria polysaccharea]
MYGGWSFLDDRNFVYLPLDDEDYDWNSASMSEKEILDFLRIKSNLDEAIGFSITWADTNIGGQVLFFPNFEFSFSITINIKNLDKDIVGDLCKIPQNPLNSHQDI